MVTVGAVGFAAAGQVNQRPEPQVRPQRYPFVTPVPDTIRRGQLSSAGVDSAQSESELPILWLGESFNGLNLTDYVEGSDPLFPRVPDAAEDAVVRTRTIVYGECVPEPGMSEPRCPVPLAITIGERGYTPSPDEVQLRPDWSGFYQVRGLKALDTESGTVLWLKDGTTVTVHAPWDARPAAVDALATANHAALGISAIESKESLAELGER